MDREEGEKIEPFYWFTPAQKKASFERYLEQELARTPPELEYECERCGAPIADGDGDLSVSTALAQAALEQGTVERWLVAHTTCRDDLRHEGPVAMRLSLPVESMRLPWQVLDAHEFLRDSPDIAQGSDWNLLRRQIAGKGLRPPP